METFAVSNDEIQEIKRKFSQPFATDYIQEHYPHLSPEPNYVQQIDCPDQLWQLVNENNVISWFFVSIVFPDTPQIDDRLEDKVFLENTIQKMLAGNYSWNQSLSLELSKALEQECLTHYRLNICLNQDDFSLISITQAEIALSSAQNAEQQHTLSTLTEQPPPKETQPKPIPLIDRQTLYDLSKQLTQSLAPQGFPIHSTLNLKLPTPAQIKPIQDRYQRTIDLSFEYSPAITEAELTEYLHRLGHYQTLKHLAHLHIFIQEQMQVWFKQNGQPSAGAIAPYLHQHINAHRDLLYERIQAHTDNQLNTSTQTLETEVKDLSIQQQQEQALIDWLEQKPLWGYLDSHLIEPDTIHKASVSPFTCSNQTIHIRAQHHTNKTNTLTFTHIASCQSDKYKAYHQLNSESLSLKLIAKYTITQKLYPQRPIFIGAAPKPVCPRLELLWREEDGSATRESLLQIWRMYPMMRTDPPQWVVIAATTDTQPLETLTLENGQIAEEGTLEYLRRSLYLMAQSEDQYTLTLSKLVTEALEHKRVKYLHIHQTEDLRTADSRDILQMQFRLLASVNG